MLVDLSSSPVHMPAAGQADALPPATTTTTTTPTAVESQLPATADSLLSFMSPAMAAAVPTSATTAPSRGSGGGSGISRGWHPLAGAGEDAPQVDSNLSAISTSIASSVRSIEGLVEHGSMAQTVGLVRGLRSIKTARRESLARVDAFCDDGIVWYDLYLQQLQEFFAQQALLCPEDIAVQTGQDEDKLAALKKMALASTARVYMLTAVLGKQVLEARSPAEAHLFREQLQSTCNALAATTAAAAASAAAASPGVFAGQ
jgi:hypothetical protein